MTEHASCRRLSPSATLEARRRSVRARGTLDLNGRVVDPEVALEPIGDHAELG
jgi:hypothetical protein